MQVWKRNGTPAQRWNIVYKDQTGGGGFGKTGEVDQDFGFKAGSGFYFVSRLPTQRVLTAVGNSNVVIKKYAKGRVS